MEAYACRSGPSELLMANQTGNTRPDACCTPCLIPCPIGPAGGGPTWSSAIRNTVVVGIPPGVEQPGFSPTGGQPPRSPTRTGPKNRCHLGLRCTRHCTGCTPPDEYRHTRQTHSPESTCTNCSGGRLGQTSVSWGTEGREFKSCPTTN